MRYYLLFLCFTAILFIACKENKTDLTSSNEEEIVLDFENLNQLDWLVGEWMHETNKEFSKETWTRLNDSTLTGFSYTQIEQDTVFAETLVLQQNKQVVSLEVVAYEQNNNAAVVFNLISGDNKEHTFENLEHDFPQRIVYTQPSKDNIYAWVEGEIDGTLKKVDFYFKRN